MEIIAKSVDRFTFHDFFFLILTHIFYHRYQRMKFSNNNKMNQIVNHNFGTLIFNQEQQKYKIEKYNIVDQILLNGF
jgi:hypothetical protein